MTQYTERKSQDVKQLNENVAILIKNQKLHQSLIDSNVQMTNITRIHLAKSRHMINRLAGMLKSINGTV